MCAAEPATEQCRSPVETTDLGQYESRVSATISTASNNLSYKYQKSLNNLIPRPNLSLGLTGAVCSLDLVRRLWFLFAVTVEPLQKINSDSHRVHRVHQTE